jgi:lysophospholipase L1-like esterase
MGRSGMFVAVAGVAVAVGALSFGASHVGALDKPGPSIRRVVTLGDSYSSGVGIHRDGSDFDDDGAVGDDCDRELDTTPGAKLADVLGATASMVACSGATIADVEAQLDAAAISGDGDGALLMLTVGGNDVRSFRGDTWPNVLLECITDLSCDDTDRNGIGNLGVVADELTVLYTSIGERYPDLTVKVLGYPRLMQSGDHWCDGVTGVNHHEADWVDGQVDVLNATIADAVGSAARETGTDIEFVPVVDQFDNNGACRFWQRDRYVNDLLLDGAAVSGATFHPSQKGYDAYFEALAASVDQAGINRSADWLSIP